MKSDKDTDNPAATAMVRNTLTLRPGSALISFKTGFESLLSAVVVIAKPLILTVISVNCRAPGISDCGFPIANFFSETGGFDLMVSAHQRRPRYMKFAIRNPQSEIPTK